MPPIETPSHGAPDLFRFAQEIHRMRRLRDRDMPSELFGEPAWDMLLALYMQHDAPLSIDRLALAPGIPESTAVRWAAALQSRGLVGRRLFGSRQGDLVSLTGEGRRILDGLFGAMLRTERQ